MIVLGAVRFPIAWVGAGAIGERGIWIAFAISNVVGAAIAYAWYRRGTWREADLTEPAVHVDDTTLDAVSPDD